jgi:hypothetical protein
MLEASLQSGADFRKASSGSLGLWETTNNGDGPVFTGLAGGVAHSYPQLRWSTQLVTQDEGNASQFQEDCDGIGA